MEHIELFLYLLGYLVTMFGAWFNLKTTVKVNATKMITSVENVEKDHSEQEIKITVLFAKLDKVNEDLINLRISSQGNATKDFLRAEHYTKGEMDQHLKMIQDGQLQNKQLLDVIHDNLLGLMKNSKNMICQS